jgi:hypothetical protein
MDTCEYSKEPTYPIKRDKCLDKEELLTSSEGMIFIK